MDWLLSMKFFDVKEAEVTDPVLLHMKPPQLTGIGGGRHTISLQSLARQNVVIAGKMRDAVGSHVFFEDNAAMHVQFADGFSKQVKDMIDDFIEKNNLSAASPEMDYNDMPDPSRASSISSVNLEEQGIGSIIWATGFTTKLNYIKLPVFDKEGGLRHKDGVSAIRGLYFLGFPWLRTRKSALIKGITEDAGFIAEQVRSYMMVGIS
jgi:putative flavoprotein involved in K+ transport